MNRRQKEVQQAFLNSEAEVLQQLNTVYHQAQQDIEEKIFELFGRSDFENLQTIVYQFEYQQAIKKQIDGILDDLNSGQFKTVADYLTNCYEEGYFGTMYDLHSQGIPIITPLDQKAVVRAVKLDSKIKGGMYSHFGENVKSLKQDIAREISRGISTGISWAQTARHITQNMIGSYRNPKGAYAYAARIARTEGHRIQIQSTMDAQQKAKDAGADIVKQWDATLDGRTRPTHQLLDGQIRELDKNFEVNGKSIAAPGMFGDPSEDCNCRCALLQRAKWALDQSELDALKERAEYFGLDKAKDFDEFKQKYLKAAENVDTINLKKGFSKALDDCKTTEDVEKLMKNSGWYYEMHKDGKVIRSVDGLSLSGCDVECAKGIYKSQERIFTKYPELIGKFNSINTLKLNSMTYAQCLVGTGHGGITVNSTYFKDVNRIIKKYDKDIKLGYHCTGTNYESIVTHEFGHALDDLLTNTYHMAGNTGKKVKYVSSMLRPKVMRACGLKVGDIEKEVSGYATKDAMEWFAECFSEWMDSPNPRKVAREFGKQLEKLMKGVEW